LPAIIGYLKARREPATGAVATPEEP